MDQDIRVLYLRVISFFRFHFWWYKFYVEWWYVE